jgi:hypothetical protein
VQEALHWHAFNYRQAHIGQAHEMWEKLEEFVDYKIKASQRTEQEPVAHPVIAGALFDFMGWLTSRKERIVLSSADEASPAVEAITEFAKMRGLSLDDAKVQDWNITPPQRTWVGLTDEEVESYWDWEDFQCGCGRGTLLDMVRDIQTKLKELNT